MKILHICTQDSDGAGKATYRLHLGLKSIGVQSKMLVLNKTSSDRDVLIFTQNNNLLRRLWDKARRKSIYSRLDSYKNSRPQGADLFTDDRTIHSISKHPLILESDIINLHWVAGMVNYTEFFSHIINKPIVWTLHDMNPFTGGCHYAGDCIRYETGCGACSQLGSQDANDLSREIWKRKERSYRGHNLQIITPSKWLKMCAEKSPLFKNLKIDIIPQGISVSVFRRRDKKFSRELLGLPQDKIILLFGVYYEIERKGFKYLIQALKLLKLDKSNIALVVFGNCINNFNKELEFPVYRLGYIQDELVLSCCYSAADFFVAPSLEDNFPNTVLESFACETPVIGFDVGGIVDIIKDGITGFLVKKMDINDLINKIDWMIKHPIERKQMGLNARGLVEQEYTSTIQAKKYQELYLNGF